MGVSMLADNSSERCPLAFRQSRREGRCSVPKPFTIMSTLTTESQDPKKGVAVDPMRRTTDPRPFDGVERRRTPGVDMSVESSNEVTVFHELGKALTSSLQLDQVLRTIMEKINEVLRPDTWSLLLMDR